MTRMLERLFGLAQRDTNVRTEIAAGATTFVTMAYIAFINPQILSAAGMPFGAVFVATCIVAASSTLVMGLFANLPIALAPGMGLNAFFAYGVVAGMGHSWQVALGAVFLSGVLFLILSVLPVRRWIIESIPQGLKLAITAGIGLFLGMIALRNAGIVQASEKTLVTVGDLLTPEPVLALLGFCAIVALAANRVRGAVLLGMLGVATAGLVLGVSEWHGFASLPPDPMPTVLALDLAGAVEVGIIAVIVTFLIVVLFDSAGTLISVAQQAQLLDDRGRFPGMRRAFIADSTGVLTGALLGSSPVTSYSESTAGVSAGGRTGLTAVTVAFLFLVCLFFAPLAESVPPYATASAILFVACLMVRPLVDLEWHDITESAAAVVTVVAIPLTFSIADGVGLGVLTYVLIKLLSGRWRECSPVLIVVALFYASKFAWL